MCVHGASDGVCGKNIHTANTTLSEFTCCCCRCCWSRRRMMPVVQNACRQQTKVSDCHINRSIGASLFVRLRGGYDGRPNRPNPESIATTTNTYQAGVGPRLVLAPDHVPHRGGAPAHRLAPLLRHALGHACYYFFCLGKCGIRRGDVGIVCVPFCGVAGVTAPGCFTVEAPSQSPPNITKTPPMAAIRRG